MMTRTTKFLVFCLAILLGAAFIAYRVHFLPQRAAARQREEEAAKLAELKADLFRAGASGGGKGRMSQRHTPRAPKARPT
jgi:hypothetical protein